MCDREKLIELLGGNLPYHSNDVAYWQDEHIGALADHLIANGVTIQRWIPVEERLPDEPMEYIVMISGGAASTTLLFDGKLWFEEDEDECRTYYPVTHWIPLPQPPKEVE